MRYLKVLDEGLGPFVAAELTEGYVLEAFRQEWDVLREDEVAARYPEALIRWRRGDDAIADRSDELEQASWGEHVRQVEEATS